MRFIVLFVLSLLFLACNPPETKEHYLQNELDFLQEMSEFSPKGNFVKEILFETVTTDLEAIEVFEDTLIPWVTIGNAHTESKNLVDKEEIVLDAQTAILIIDYPLESPVEIEINSKNPEGFTRLDLLMMISENYIRIYKEEEESSSTEVIPIEERDVINRNSTDGKYGIWGHDLNDLDLSGIEVWKDGSTNYLYLYVES